MTFQVLLLPGLDHRPPERMTHWAGHPGVVQAAVASGRRVFANTDVRRWADGTHPAWVPAEVVEVWRELLDAKGWKWEQRDDVSDRIARETTEIVSRGVDAARAELAAIALLKG